MSLRIARKKLPLINAKYDVSCGVRALLVFCALFGNQLNGSVANKPTEGGKYEPPLLLLNERLQNFTNLQKLPVISSGEIIQRSKIPDYIRGSLSSLCEKCSESQRRKVEQILFLLFNFNSQGDEQVHSKTDDNEPNVGGTKQEKFSSSTHTISQHGDKSRHKKNPTLKKKTTLPQHLLKEKSFPETYKSTKFKATSAPKSSPLIPTPEFQYYQGIGGGGVIQLPTHSTTPSSSSVPPAFSILPYYYPSTPSSSPSPTLPFPASFMSTTMSSALEPVQSVEMPTPPLPPTTTGPIYFYYLPSSSMGTGSSSEQPPTTPVVESSVASKPTTIEP